MSFSEGFRKQAFVGAVVRPLARAGLSLGKKLTKMQGGALNTGMNVLQVAGDTSSYLNKFKGAERGISGIR